MTASLSITAERRSAMLRTAFGPLIATALADDAVIEIMANPDGALWVERRGAGRDCAGVIAAYEAERIIRLVAGSANAECRPEAPIVSAELPETGERFEGLLPPVALGPCFAIRKPARTVFSLDDYVRQQIITYEQACNLRQAISARQNVLIAGGASSGKTTLANALLVEIAKLGDRIVILEDTRELNCSAEDCVSLRTTPGLVSLKDLVRSTLRLRPDRIIIGETRGGEALDLLKAWNTGHPGGFATIHANSAGAALSRLEQLIAEAAAFQSQTLIAESVDLIVFIASTANGRKVKEIASVEGWCTDEGYRLIPFQNSDLANTIQE